MIRAIEGASPDQVSACLTRLPDLRDHVANPYVFGSNTSRSLDRLRAYAVKLAREHALHELTSSREDL
eukprot:1962138-Pyramimonas_sp.AAC.1